MEQPDRPVVVGTDGSEQAAVAVRWAAGEAVLRGRTLRIVYAVDTPGFQPLDVEEHLNAGGRRLLEDAAAQARASRPDVHVTTAALRVEMPRALREEAETAFELVIGSRGIGGFRGLVLGSTAMRLAGRVPGPVVVVRGETETRHGRIVLGVDPFHKEPDALVYAFDAAAARGAEIHAIHAFQMADTILPLAPTIPAADVVGMAKEELDRTLAPVKERFPQVRVQERIVQGHPVEMLTEASGSADLLVLGAHGHTALGGLIVGSTTQAAFQHARCPVAAVRPRE